MKLLFDNNLSPKLVTRLASLFPDSNHVSALQLDTASDLKVWEYARQQGYCLVSKDSDFNELIASNGFPPKLIWIRIGNCTTTEIIELLQTHHEAIVEFGQMATAGLLELT
jgi:predicted nuclease of predicted toxin-antitoxin system